jgi:hypothetical protein
MQPDTAPAVIFAEIARIERELESPESKGKRTILKAYHRKLCGQYLRASQQVSA